MTDTTSPQTTEVMDPPAATTPSVSESPEPDAGYTGWLLGARAHAAIRSDLRRADIAALEARAYRHLARFWAGSTWRRTPILLHAALAASCTHITQSDRVGLGALARNLVARGVLGESTVGARLLAIQRMDLATAHRHIATLLRTGEASGAALDWHALYRTYRSWDHPDLKTRTQVRRRVLEQFHSADPSRPIEHR